MSEIEVSSPQDLSEFRADTLLMHGELLELELYKIRRELFADPGAVKLLVGAGQPAEQTITGDQRDPFNGVVIYNPTPVTLAVGFQAGAGVLAPATVPPWSWASFPERYTNLSIAVLNVLEQQAATANPVTILRTRIAPAAGAGPYGSLVAPQPFTSLPAGSSGAGAGAVLDLGYPRSNHSCIVVGSAGVTGGTVALQVSHDGTNFFQVQAIGAAVGAAGGSPAGPWPARYVRAAITAAITGGTVTATVASSG